MRRWSKAAAIAAMTLVVGNVQAKPAQTDVLSLVEKNYNIIRDYKVDIAVSVDTPQVRMPRSTATVYYKKPDKVKMVPKQGFMVLPKQVVPSNPVAGIRNNYRVASTTGTKVNGADAYLVKLVPKAGGNAMKLYVEKKRGLILATDTSGEGMSFKSKWSYVSVDGKYWLPSQVNVDMKGISSAKVSDPKVKKPEPGCGKACVKFTNYRVNRGIPDSVFGRGR